MSSVSSELTEDDMLDIVNKNVPEMVKWFIKVRNNFLANKGNVSEELRTKIWHAEKLYKIWVFRLNQIEQAAKRREARQDYQQRLQNSQSKDPKQDEDVDDDNDKSDEESVSDVDYEERHQDKIENILRRCKLEGGLLKSMRGFRIVEHPQYTV